MAKSKKEKRLKELQKHSKFCVDTMKKYEKKFKETGSPRYKSLRSKLLGEKAQTDAEYRQLAQEIAKDEGK